MCNNVFKFKAEVSFVKILPILLIVLFTAFSGARVDAAPIDNSSGIISEKLIGSLIRQHYKNENRKITIHIGKNRLVLPDNCIIDVETGSGHGGDLNFFRLNLKGADGSIEKILLNHGSILVPDPKEKCRVKRAVLKRKDMKDILEAVALLPAIRLIEKSSKKTSRAIKNKDGTFTMILSDIEPEWGSDSSFFVLFRVLDENRKILIEKEYAGYSGSTDQLDYLPILAVCNIVEDRLDKISQWKEVPLKEQRECHLSDAFNLNRNYFLKDFHWWVLENSLEGLAQAGNQSVQETINYILANYTSRTDRLVNKINAIAKDFDYWLSGAPKDLAAIK
jgi:hypothetical protein